MSSLWNVWHLSDWTSAGGIVEHDLGPALEGSQIRLEVGGRGAATLVLDKAIAAELAQHRRIVGVEIDAQWYEFRCSGWQQVTIGRDATRTTVTALPRIFDLGDSDLVREVLAGRTRFSIDASLRIEQWWERLVAPRLAQDGLRGLALGVVETTQPVPLTIKRWTYGQLVQGFLDATQLELQWRVSADRRTEYLDFVEQVGKSAPVLALTFGDQLLDHQPAEDYNGLFTVARIAGAEPTAESEAATIADAAWRVASVRTIAPGRVAVRLEERAGTRSPVVDDGQWAAHPDLAIPARYLQWADGTTRTPILDAIAATGEVVVATAPPAIDPFVQVVADAAGSPLEVIELPTKIRKYGRVVGDVSVPAGRGERQYLLNGGHEAGLARWSAVGGAAAQEIRRNELGITVNAAADGARAAGLATTTPFAIRGLTPLTGRVLRGDAMLIGGAVLPIASDVIPDSTGAITLPLSSGVPANYPDNSPFTLVRREVRTLTLDGVQNPFAPFLKFRDVNTDGMLPNNAGTIASAVGGYTNDTAVFDFSGYYDIPGIRAGRVLVNTGPTLQWASYLQDVYIMAGTSLNYVVGDAVGTFTFVSMAAQVAGGTHGTIVIGSVVRTFRSNGQWQYLRVTAIAGGVYSFATIDGAPVVASGGFDLFQVCNRLLADGSLWEFTAIRETRTVYCDGPVSAGAVTLPCKAQANLATRNWAATDTISLTRSVSVTLEVTEHTASTYTNVVYDPITGEPVLDEFGDPVVVFGGTQHAITLNLAASTIDEAFAAGDVPTVTIMFGGVPVTINAGGLSGSTLNGVTPGNVVDSGAIAAGTYTATWTVTDAYALTGTAAWNTNGRVTLTLAAPIPPARSYLRGQPVTANWISGALWLHAAAESGDNTVTLVGADNFFSTSSPTAALRGSIYRITASGSTLPIPGATLYANSTGTADATGRASVTLKDAASIEIPDGAAVVIRRPALVPATEPQTGSVLRLFCGIAGITGEPLSSSPGWTHELAHFEVPDDTERAITAISLFGLSIADWMPPLGPACAIVDASGTILGWSALGDDGALIEVEPGVVLLTTRATIRGRGRYTVRVYGGNPNDYTLWCAHVRTMLYQGDALDAPYTPTDHASQLQLLGTRALLEGAEPRATDRLTLKEFGAAEARSRGVPLTTLPRVTLGGEVLFTASGRRLRVRAFTIRPTLEHSDVELGQVPPNGARLLGATALAAQTRRTR